MTPECCGADRKNRSEQPRDRCGLYFGPAGRIQELQKGTDTLGPSGFVVLAAFDALVVQVAAELPTFLQKQVAKLFDVLDDARALACADVQPDRRTRIHDSSRCEAMHDLVVPPDR